MNLEKVYVNAQKAANELKESVSIFKIDDNDYEYAPFDGSDVTNNRFVEKIEPKPIITKTPLPTTIEEALKYARKNDRIVPWAAGGQHIPLTCKNHPNLRWSTKNISAIGARSIFFDLMHECKESECDCSGNDLMPVVPENWQELIIPLKIVCCNYCGVEVCEETATFSHGSCRDCGSIVQNNFRRYFEILKEISGGSIVTKPENERKAFAQLKKEVIY